MQWLHQTMFESYLWITCWFRWFCHLSSLVHTPTYKCKLYINLRFFINFKVPFDVLHFIIETVLHVILILWYNSNEFFYFLALLVQHDLSLMWKFPYLFGNIVFHQSFRDSSFQQLLVIPYLPQSVLFDVYLLSFKIKHLLVEILFKLVQTVLHGVNRSLGFIIELVEIFILQGHELNFKDTVVKFVFHTRELRFTVMLEVFLIQEVLPNHLCSF